MRPEGTIVISIENHYCCSVCVTGPEGKQGVLSGSLHWSNEARTGADVVVLFSIDSCCIVILFQTRVFLAAFCHPEAFCFGFNLFQLTWRDTDVFHRGMLLCLCFSKKSLFQLNVKLTADS